MKLLKHNLTFILTTAILVIGCTSENKPKNESNLANSELNQPNKNAPSEIMQYGKLVGAWDCTISSYNADTLVATTNAEWVFKYALNGYAIQDFWKNPSKIDSANQKQVVGTNLRIYNPQLNLWQCAWAENQPGSLSGVWKSHEEPNGDLLLYDDTKSWQIKFYNITKNHFDWKWEVMQPDSTFTTTATITASKVK